MEYHYNIIIKSTVSWSMTRKILTIDILQCFARVKKTDTRRQFIRRLRMQFYKQNTFYNFFLFAKYITLKFFTFPYIRIQVRAI